MADRNGLADTNDTPEDVATLYSWANLHGAKYRDFSASRAQTREKARQRVEEAIEAEHRRAQEEAEAQKLNESRRAAEEERLARQSAEEESRYAQQLAAEQRAAEETAARRNLELRMLEEQAAARRQAEERARQRAEEELHQRAWKLNGQPSAYAPQPAPSANLSTSFMAAPSYTPGQVPEWLPASEPAPYAAPPTYQQPMQQPVQYPAQYPAQQPVPQQVQNRYSAPPAPVAAPPSYAEPARPAAPAAPPSPTQPAYAPPPAYRYASAPQEPLPQQAPAYYPPVAPASRPMREETMSQARSPWDSPETRETLPRPAWLSPERPATAAPAPVPQAPDDTLQGSRDRLTSRWFALKTVFAGGPAPVEAPPAQETSRAPILAVFSLAGGVGKTSLVATLGRTLSARGERVLLVDTAAYGLLPFFFGARDQRPGVLRTFSPPGVTGDAPIQTLTVDPETLGAENSPQEPLSQEITRHGRGVSRVIVDLATASGATTRRVLRMSPVVLVPVLPDMSSVVSVTAIDSFFQRNTAAAGQPVLPYYVVNQFDSSLPLHLDVREVLREQLGDRLLPFALRRTPALSEALAEGMTLVDYAPNSPAAEDFAALANWVKSLAPPASTGYRGVRWSER